MREPYAKSHSSPSCAVRTLDVYCSVDTKVEERRRCRDSGNNHRRSIPPPAWALP